MDSKLRIAIADGHLSLAEEVFYGRFERGGLRRGAQLRLERALRFTIRNYKEALADQALDEELREKAEANLQRAQEMYNELVEIILSKED